MALGPRCWGQTEGRGVASPRLPPLGPGGCPPPLAPGPARRPVRRRCGCPPLPGPAVFRAARGLAHHSQRRLLRPWRTTWCV
eukprot:2518626-Pyramimonas_sp.AAC.1